MTIVLSQNVSENNRLTKTLLNSKDVDGRLRDECDVEYPKILFEISDLINFNYAYIPLYNRYYFVNNWRVVRNGLMTADFTVDVLMSFKEQISQLNIILEATEKYGTNYMPSEVFNTLVKDTTSVLNFQNGLLNNGEFILITAGG